MLNRDDLLSPSIQDKNAGNSGDQVKHLIYLSLLRELNNREVNPDVVEAHGGKGVYVSSHRHLLRSRGLPGYQDSLLGRAQTACFAEPPAGLGGISGLRLGEVPYAGSVAMHAQEVKAGRCSSLTILDKDPGVQAILERVVSEPCFSAVHGRLAIEKQYGDSEQFLLSRLADGQFGPHHVLHFDPFAFVMSQADLMTRMTYGRLVQECDSRIGEKALKSASIFFTWGSNGTAALADLDGNGYDGGIPDGYQALLSLVAPERRIVVVWCWEMYFAQLVIVSADLKDQLVKRIETETAVLRPLLSRLQIVA